MTTPPSLTAVPATLCPPPRTETGSPCSRANATAAITSALPVQRTTSAGRRSMIAVPDPARLVVRPVAVGDDLAADPLAAARPLERLRPQPWPPSLRVDVARYVSLRRGLLQGVRPARTV